MFQPVSDFFPFLMSHSALFHFSLLHKLAELKALMLPLLLLPNNWALTLYEHWLILGLLIEKNWTLSIAPIAFKSSRLLFPVSNNDRELSLVACPPRSRRRQPTGSSLPSSFSKLKQNSPIAETLLMREKLSAAFSDFSCYSKFQVLFSVFSWPSFT